MHSKAIRTLGFGLLRSHNKAHWRQLTPALSNTIVSPLVTSATEPQPKSGIPRAMKSQLHKRQMVFDILYEDDHIVAVNKPANMLSVAGVGSRNLFYEPKVEPVEEGSKKMRFNPRFVARTTKFSNAIAAAAAQAHEEGNTAHCNILDLLMARDNGIPRKKRIFLDYISKKPFSCDDENLRLEIWERVAKCDFEMMGKEKDMSSEDYEHCVPDILELMYGKRIYVVHRLDQETSGVLVFAKTDAACAGLTRQFREKDLHKQYIAKVIGRVDESLTEIDVPIRPDKDNRPYQVRLLFPANFRNRYIHLCR
jgi:hypothetical protein